MGKAQSKRSVDITTEVVADEGTGRVEKIEDVDQLKPQPQINGDTQHSEPDNEKQSIENKENEHEKDLANEKEKALQSEVIDLAQGKDDEAVTKSNQNEDLNESKVNDTTTESSTPDSKKAKKDKLKKKWSFRSISFGKKDKQKPLKKAEEKTGITKEEEGVAASSTVTDNTTNGECDKVPDENVTDEKLLQEEYIANTVPQTTVSEETQNDVEPVTNGESAIPAQTLNQKEVEVPEETKTKVVSNYTTEEIENSTEPIILEIENKDEAKFNGDGSDIERTIIEVKSENEKINVHSQNISDSSIQTQPPPLPISPQPSQVLSFALNGGNHQQNNDNKQAPHDLDVSPNLKIPSVIETAPTPEVEIMEDLSQDLDENNHGTIPDPIEENKFSARASKVDSEQNKYSDTDIETNVINLEDSNIASKSLEEKEDADEQNHIKEKDEDFENDNSDEKDIQCTEVSKEKEQIAESFVEEVTIKAVEIVEKQLRNEDLSSFSPSSCLENTTNELSGLNNGHASNNVTNDENLSETTEAVPDVDDQSSQKKNGTEHEDNAPMKEIQNGLFEITKTIEEIKLEPEAKSCSTENSSPVIVTVAE